MDSSTPEDDNPASIRAGAREMLRVALAKIGASHPASDIRDTAAAMEEVVFQANLARPGSSRSVYACSVRAFASFAGHQLGLHPADVVGCKLLRGELRPKDAFDIVNAGYEPPTPRDIITTMFAATLIRASDEYGKDRQRVLDDARAIEQSCFNAVVTECKRVENPPRRQWDSPAFVDMYSGRCGRVDALLDPASSSCRAYGVALVPQLLAGEIKAAAIGKMSCVELCPAATETEREEIARRSRQKIEGKTSNLFKCPNCSERKTTYIEKFIRGTDEAPDYMCTCCVCGTRFKGKS